MLDLDAVATRIKTECPTLMRRVGLTSEFSEATSTDMPGADINVPHAFVIPLYERAEERDDKQGAVQDEQAYFAVVVCVDNTPQGGRGGASKSAASAMAVLRTVKQELCRALLTWTPPEASGQVSFEQGFHISMNNSRLWHQFQWSAPTRLVGNTADPTVPDPCDPSAPTEVDAVLAEADVWPPKRVTAEIGGLGDLFALADQPDGHGQRTEGMGSTSSAEEAFLSGEYHGLDQPDIPVSETTAAT